MEIHPISPRSRTRRSSRNSVLAPPRLKAKPDVSHFDKLPDAALVAIDALAVVMGKGVSTAWRDVKNDADFPRPIRMSAGCTRFKVGDIRAYLAKKAEASAGRVQKQRQKMHALRSTT